VNVTASPYRFRQCFLNGAPQAGVIVADHELHSVQRALPPTRQQFFPARQAFAASELDRKNVPPSFPIDADRDQHGLATDSAILPHFLIAGIQNQVWVGLLQTSRNYPLDIPEL
jgi:hypothetical protein